MKEMNAIANLLGVVVKFKLPRSQTDRSKYKPHNGRREKARRLNPNWYIKRMAKYG